MRIMANSTNELTLFELQELERKLLYAEVSLQGTEILKFSRQH